VLTRYDQIEARTIKAQQRIFGSCFDILPMKVRPNKRAVRDRVRQAQVNVQGIRYTHHQLTDIDKSDHIDRANRSKSMSFNNVSGRKIHVEFLYCDLDWIPQQHDVIILKDSDLAYEIIDQIPSGHSDIKFHVGEIEGPYSVDS